VAIESLGPKNHAHVLIVGIDSGRRLSRTVEPGPSRRRSGASGNAPARSGSASVDRVSTELEETAVALEADELGLG
jgi:hypothetical protein